MSYIQDKQAAMTGTIQHLVARFNFLSDIPERKRTDAENNEYEEVLADLRENYKVYFDVLTKYLFESIMVDFDSTSETPTLHYQNELARKENKPPALVYPVTTDQIERAIPQIHTAQITVFGFLEELEPQYKKWLVYIDRAERLFGAITNFKEKWRNDGLFEILVPHDVYKRVQDMGELVATLKYRKEILDKSFEIVSRVITLRTGTPVEPISKVSDTNRPELGDSSFGNGRGSFKDRLSKS